MNKDIFQNKIIEYKDIENNLVQIFIDTIITDTNFIIMDISDSVVGILKYRKKQILGNHISKILFKKGTDLILLLNKQYFTHEEISLKDSAGNEIEVFFSAYFLGLISDLNGKIIIQVKNRKDFFSEKKRLEKELLELNELIYRTSHDIRGPLMTIKGLALAAQPENNTILTKKYLKLIEQVVAKLDLKLQYLRESLLKKNRQCDLMNTKELFNSISNRIAKLSEVYNLKIDLNKVEEFPDIPFFSNKFLLSALIENLILIIESICEIEISKTYSVSFAVKRNEIKVILESKKISSIVSEHLSDRYKLREVVQLISRNGYNYLDVKILKISIKIIKARIYFDKKLNSQIIIVIPSQLI